jgi:hypothetical protein
MDYWASFREPGPSIIGWILIMGFYFLPTIIAGSRKHHNWLAIGLTNFFFGWTVIGWIISLIWSVKK